MRKPYVLRWTVSILLTIGALVVFGCSSSSSVPGEGIIDGGEDGRVDGGEAMADARVTARADGGADASEVFTTNCTLPWGGSLPHGESVTAYAEGSIPAGTTCSSEMRTCNDGNLSGSFTFMT